MIISFSCTMISCSFCILDHPERWSERSAALQQKCPFIQRWLAHEATLWKQRRKTLCRPVWTPAVHVHNLQLSSAASLSARVAVWLSSSAWMNSGRSEMWSVIRFGWFNVEMERPADANWADVSAVSTSLLKNHRIIGLRRGWFKASFGFNKKRVCVLLLPLSLPCSHSCCWS